MESTSSDASFKVHYNPLLCNKRSLPIPKEVNNFVLKNYGKIYYLTQDCSEKAKILQNIEVQLQKAGYNITWSEVERRLKNMKSHYRRKKSDLVTGLVSSVEWEYFNELDSIFSPVVKPRESDETFPKQETKRKSEPEPEPIEEKEEKSVDGTEAKPQDLSIKRTRIIEFCHVSDLNSQIPVKQTEEAQREPTPKQPDENQTLIAIQKIIESLKAVDQHRLVLDQQRMSLEIRRYELDCIGYQLSELLSKMTQPPENPDTVN